MPILWIESVGPDSRSRSNPKCGFPSKWKIGPAGPDAPKKFYRVEKSLYNDIQDDHQHRHTKNDKLPKQISVLPTGFGTSWFIIRTFWTFCLVLPISIHRFWSILDAFCSANQIWHILVHIQGNFNYSIRCSQPVLKHFWRYIAQIRAFFCAPNPLWQNA